MDKMSLAGERLRLGKSRLLKEKSQNNVEGTRRTMGRTLDYHMQLHGHFYTVL